MSITQKFTLSISSDQGGTPLSGVQTEVGNLGSAINQNFGASLTDQLFPISFTLASLQSIFLLSDKGLTIEINSGTSPVDTIVLKPGTPYQWGKSSGYVPCLITADVTAFYITTTLAAILQGYVLTT